MEEIKNWLSEENPDFDQGFNLLKLYSRNQSLISYIGRKRHGEMLRYELKKLASNKVMLPNPHAKTSVVPAKPKTVVVDERKVNREELPEEMQKVYDLIVDDYKEMRILHEKMKMANSDVGRAEFREKIIKINQKIKKRWEIIDTGKFPEDTKGTANINSARAYISKMMKKEDLTAEQRELVKQKLNTIITAGEALKPETLQKLKEKGF